MYIYIHISGHEFNSLSERTLYSHSNFISLFSVHVSFRSLPSPVATFALSEVSHSIHVTFLLDCDIRYFHNFVIFYLKTCGICATKVLLFFY